MKKILSFIILALIAVGCHYGETREQKSDNFISIGKKEKIQSKVLGEEREIWVYVPPYSLKSGKKFPVLYLLDGDAHFHSVTGLIQILGTGVNGTRVVPEMIVVAIPNTDRTRDLTPSHSDNIEGKTEPWLKVSGGGDNFLKFIQSELIPYVESAYPTNPYRVLVGHSFGGIAAINALYTMPGTFDSYVVIDPSLWWDEQLLLKKADSVFSTNNFANKYLYLAQANTLENGEKTNSHFGSIKEYVKVLESPKNTSGIRWAYKYYPDDSHGSVPFISEYDGLRFAFKDFNPDYDKIGMDPVLLQKNFTQYKMAAPEEIVNGFGYTAMVKKDLDLAKKYFQMNLDAYPQSSNAHDSMGALLLNKGDTLDAVKMYEKSLALDSKNDNAKKVLNELMAKKHAK
jgi:predicted alpha/beta superfamily hydrolase